MEDGKETSQRMWIRYNFLSSTKQFILSQDLGYLGARGSGFQLQTCGFYQKSDVQRAGLGIIGGRGVETSELRNKRKREMFIC